VGKHELWNAMSESELNELINKTQRSQWQKATLKGRRKIVHLRRILNNRKRMVNLISPVESLIEMEIGTIDSFRMLTTNEISTRK
jgi:hypothetical protein